MAETRFPEEVRALVRNHVASMVHLDALLLLAASSEALSAALVAQRVGTDAAIAERALRDLAASRLVTAQGEGAAERFRFAPTDPELRRSAELLGEMYRRFPVQVVRAVYERPPTAVQQLADAFRLKGP